MLIILDLGANDGCSARKFVKMMNDMNITEYRIYSFEPNIFFKDKLLQLQHENDKVSVYFNILGCDNRETKLFLSQQNNCGSSIFSDKTTNKISSDLFINVREVNIIDFINNLPKHDKLWIKMDIEGAEYSLISHLNKNNYIDKFSTLFIEWHYKKIPSISIEEHHLIKSMVSKLECEDWCALNLSDRTANFRNEYQHFLKKLKIEK